MNLHRLFVYNTTFGKTEDTEHEKIMYYYPEQLDLDSKQKSVGLSEAIVNFTRTFSPEQPAEFMHTEKRKHIFIGCEPNFWMVMIVERDKNKAGEDTHDSILKAILTNVYKTFKMFNGSFQSLLDKYGVDELRLRIQAFLKPYIATVLKANLSTADVFDAMDGIFFLPVDAKIFMRIQFFVNSTENRFPVIRHSVVFFDRQLVLSGLTHDEVRVCSKYLVSVFEEQNKVLFKDEEGYSYSLFGSRSEGGFLTGPDGNAPRIFVTGRNSSGVIEEEQESSLVIFQYSRMTIFFLVDPSVTREFYVKLNELITGEIPALLALVSENVGKIPAFDDTYKYIYFNHMNLAIKTSIKKKNIALSAKEFLSILSDIHADFDSNVDGLKEVYMKTRKDGWIVGKKFGNREFYVIFEQKNYSLIEVNEEVHKVSGLFFSSKK